MGRPSNRIPSYLPHASGQARVRIDGRDVYLGRFGSDESKEKYARLIAEQFANGPRRTISLAVGEVLSIAALVVKYDDHATSYYRKNGEPTSQVERIRSAVRPLVVIYGSTPAAEFSPTKLKAVRTALIESGSQRRGKKGKRLKTPLSRGYVNSLVSCVKRMFKWAVAEELVPVSTYQALDTVESLKKGRTPNLNEPEKVKPVPEVDIPPVLTKVSPQIRTMIELQLLTGMRPDEVTIMRPCDIERTGDIWVFRPANHKTEHHEIEKEILLGPNAQKLLEPWLRRDASAYIFSPREVMEAIREKRRKNRTTPMTPSQANRRPKTKPIKAPREHYDDESYCQAVQKACERAGVSTWTPGRLRHNAATRLRAKYGIEAARLVLGHENLSTTEIYAERDMTQYAQIMRETG